MGKVLWVIAGTTAGALVGFYYQNQKIEEFRALNEQRKGLKAQDLATAGRQSGVVAGLEGAVAAANPDCAPKASS
jgi:hypothetical protein